MPGFSTIMNFSSLKLFTDEKHLPFTFEGENAAVLMIHGFLGTPAEMRPLAEKLLEAGVSVHAPLLPGFGAEIEAKA